MPQSSRRTRFIQLRRHPEITAIVFPASKPLHFVRISQYRFRGPRPYPDMRVRIYHDAHLVEAQALQAFPRDRRGSPERELDQRWARNMMLNKWLEYCVERGHRFSSRTEQRAGA